MKEEGQLGQEGVGLGQGVGHILYRIRLQQGVMFNHEVRARGQYRGQGRRPARHVLQVGPNVADLNDNNNRDNVPDQEIDHASDDSSMNIADHKESLQEHEW